MPGDPSTPRFFATPTAFRKWLDRNHAKAGEIVVGFYKKGTGRPSITWSEAVDEALCFGWIDGIRRRIDEESYSNRFTPRRVGSNWSAVNVKRVEALMRDGKMAPAGLEAFEARRDEKTGIYSYEQRFEARLGEDQLARFQADPVAWKYFQSVAPGYRRLATWWVVSAKKKETQERRLTKLIEDSRAGRPIGQMTRKEPP